MAYVWMKLEREVGELSIRVLQILLFFFFSKLGKWKAFPEKTHWQLLIKQNTNTLLPKTINKIDLFEKKADS